MLEAVSLEPETPAEKGTDAMTLTSRKASTIIVVFLATALLSQGAAGQQAKDGTGAKQITKPAANNNSKKAVNEKGKKAGKKGAKPEAPARHP